MDFKSQNKHILKKNKANFLKSINSLARKATNIFSVTLSILPRTNRGIPFKEGLFNKSWSSTETGKLS